MTAPEGSAAAPPPVSHPRATNILLGKPLTALRAARIIATVTIAVTVIARVLMRFTDAKQFANIGDGLWWAIQTVTTVGYGDLVPTSVAGRLVAALVMVVGIGFLTVITAAITSTFIETARRRVEGATTDALSAKLDQIASRLDGIEEGFANNRGRDRDDPRVPRLLGLGCAHGPRQPRAPARRLRREARNQAHPMSLTPTAPTSPPRKYSGAEAVAVFPFAAAGAGAWLVAAAVGVFGRVALHQLGRCSVGRKQVGHDAHRSVDVVEEELVAGA